MPLNMLQSIKIPPSLQRFIKDQDLLIWGLAIVIGLLAGYAAILFREFIGLIQWFWLGTTSEHIVDVIKNTHWFFILAAPMLGGYIVGLILQHWMPGHRSHGVADVLEAQAIHDSRMPVKTGLYSALVALISLGAGASAGREGPVVHLGASLASALLRIFHLPASAWRILLACGVASAVSASFNVPIAGVLFAHEIILRHYALRAFVPITLASITGALIIRSHIGDFPTFQIPQYELSSHWEFPAFALLGLFCALVAIIFHMSLVKSDEMARRVNIPLVMRPVIGGFIVGLMGLFIPQIMGVGYDSTDAALKQQFGMGMLLLLLVFKIIATSVTLASRFGGGVFSPSLYLGAMAGGVFGLVAGSLYPGLASSHGLYAIAGMGAVAAAILGAPISTSMIAFELTGDYNTAIVILVAVSISSAFHNAIMGGSFFQNQLLQRGLQIIEGPHQNIMRRIRVAAIMKTVEQDDEPAEIDLEDEEVRYLKPSDNLETALKLLDQAGQAKLPVVGSDNKSIIGYLNQVAALKFYNQALVDAHKEEHS